MILGEPKGNVMTGIVNLTNTSLHPLSSTEVDQVNKFLGQQIADGTRRVYRSDWRLFGEWCHLRELDPNHVTPEAVAMFLVSQFNGGIKPSTLVRRLAAIKFAYECRDAESPTDKKVVRATLRGIKRDVTAPRTQHKKALTTDKIIELIQCIPISSNLRDIRNRALFILGFAGAFRRSELVSIRYEDIEFVNKECGEIGMDITLWKSKANQEGKKQVKPIIKGKHVCPLQAIKRWITAANITDGYLFRAISRTGRVLNKPMSTDTVYQLIKQYSMQSGYDFYDFSPHSLRLGFITSSVEAGKKISKIKGVTLQKSDKILLAYIQHSERYDDHAGDGVY